MSKCLPRATICRLCLKCDDTRTETRFRLSAKQTSPFKSAGASVQSTSGTRGARIYSSNAGYTMFWGSVKGTGYPLHSTVSPSLPLPCIKVKINAFSCGNFNRISFGKYLSSPPWVLYIHNKINMDTAVPPWTRSVTCSASFFWAVLSSGFFCNRII